MIPSPATAREKQAGKNKQKTRFGLSPNRAFAALPGAAIILQRKLDAGTIPCGVRLAVASANSLVGPAYLCYDTVR